MVCVYVCAMKAFGVLKLQCVSFLNITKSLSNYSTILVHLLGTNGTIEEIGSLCLSLDGVVNAVVSTNCHPSDYKPFCMVLYQVINFNTQYFKIPLLSLPCLKYIKKQ